MEAQRKDKRKAKRQGKCNAKRNGKRTAKNVMAVSAAAGRPTGVRGPWKVGDEPLGRRAESTMSRLGEEQRAYYG